MDSIKTPLMTVSSAPTVKDKKLTLSGLVESSSVNSITDFIPSKLNEKYVLDGKEKVEFINTFICHFIFYAVFCISLVLYIFIDLGLGSFVEKMFIQFIDVAKKYLSQKLPAYA